MASHFEKGAAAKFIDLQKPNLETRAFSKNGWDVADMIAIEHGRILIIMQGFELRFLMQVAVSTEHEIRLPLQVRIRMLRNLEGRKSGKTPPAKFKAIQKQIWKAGHLPKHPTAKIKEIQTTIRMASHFEKGAAAKFIDLQIY